MEQKMNSKNWYEKVTKILSNIVLLLTMACLTLLCVRSVFVRTFMAMKSAVEGESYEHVLFYSLNPAVQILTCVAVLAVIFASAFLIRRGLNGNARAIVAKLPFILTGVLFAVGLMLIIFVKTTPSLDGGYCSVAAMQMLTADSRTMYDARLITEQGLPGGYIAAFPFQLGYVLLLEILYRIFGTSTYVPILVFNLISICTAQLLLALIVKKITYKKYADLASCVTSVLAFFFFPWLMYTAFCYGNMPSTTFVLAACFHCAAFAKKPNVKTGVCLILFCTIAMLLKAMALIPLIAFAIVLVLLALQQKNVKILILVAMLLIPYYAPNAVTALYEARCGMPLAPGTPKTTWIAMGLEDTSGLQPGGFNGRTYFDYQECGADYDETNRSEIEIIKERLNIFREDPKYAAQFFLKKIEAQWLDPSFGVLYILWASSVDKENIILSWEGLYQPMGWFWSIQAAIQWCVLLLAVQWGVFAWKKIKPGHLLLYLTFLGGFLYLIISEAKAQYAISYYILLLPYAACALAADANYITMRLQKNKLSQKEKPDDNQ